VAEAQARRRDGFELALGALGQKERTSAEMEGWLRERDVPEDELVDVMERLAESGGIDDERFAARFAEDKRELRGWGPERIAEALRARGVGEGEIEGALAAEPHEQVMDRATELLADAGADLGDEAGRGRALSLLARRGFPLEVAYDAIRRAS
jgi:regulatory protein